MRSGCAKPGNSRVDRSNPLAQRLLAERGTRALDVDLVVDADPAPAAEVLRLLLDRDRRRQRERAHRDDVQRLIGTEAVARVEGLARHHDFRLQTVERFLIADTPRLRHLAPVRDRDVARLAGVGLMEERRVEVEAVGLDAKVRIGDAAFADQDDLLAASEGLDDAGPLLQRRVVRELVHSGRS